MSSLDDFWALERLSDPDHDHDHIARPSRLIDANAALRFIHAGNAYLTLRSLKTQTRFTYRVRQAKDNATLYFVSVLTGSDNNSSYTYLGHIKRDVYFHDNKSRISRDAPSAKAFEWTWRRLITNGNLDQLEIWHEGRCGKCGRKLTVPESIEMGFGPECAGRMGL